jgi:hypothetical protein
MKILHALTVLISLFVFTACAVKKPKAKTPSFFGITSKAKSATESVTKATEDSEAVRKLQLEAMELLDRLDYKATVLLEQ